MQDDPEDPRLNPVMQRIYFEYVDSHGYPNGQPTWDELLEQAKTDHRAKDHASVFTAMAVGVLEVIDYLAEKGVTGQKSG